MRIVFMGTPEFSVPALEKIIETEEVVLVVTKEDAPIGRKRILTPSPVAVCAEKYGIEVFKPHRLKNDYQKIMEAKPDLIITCAYGQIVPKEVLDAPLHGCINIHASLLPKYRGANPICASIMNGEEKTGITIMYMEETLDTGDMLYQKEVPILESDHLGTVENKLSLLGAQMIAEFLPNLQNGTIKRVPQNEKDATYVGMLRRKDENIDFHKTKREVFNHIRALYPKPMASTIIDSKEWKICEALEYDEVCGEIGIISEVGKDYLAINCKDGRIKVIKIKPAGKNEMSVRDYFNGINKESLVGKKVEINEETK